MRKKYLSALLFGALVMASTATFTSCKDYDDDIENLQNQINTVVSDLASLKTQVGSKGVTSVTVANGKLVVVTDGATSTMDLPAGVQVSEIEIKNGHLFVAGEDKGAIDAPATPGEAAQKVEVKDGYLYIDDVKQDLKVGSDVVVKDASNGVYTISIDGQTITLPMAASTALPTLSPAVGTSWGRTWNVAWGTATEDITFGAETISAGTFLLGGMTTTTSVVVSPVTYDLSAQTLSLVDMDGNLAPVIVSATPVQSDATTGGRAVATDGQWTISLKMADSVTADNIATAFTKKVGGIDQNLYYALAINGNRVSPYKFVIDTQTVNESQANAKVDINTAAAIAVKSAAGTTTVKIGGDKMTITGTDAAKVVSSYLVFEGRDKLDAESWGVIVDGMTITAPVTAAGKTIKPKLCVLDVTGNVQKSNNPFSLTIASTQASVAETAAVVKKVVNSEASFTIDLGTIFTNLDANIALAAQSAELTTTNGDFFSLQSATPASGVYTVAPTGDITFKKADGTPVGLGAVGSDIRSITKAVVKLTNTSGYITAASNIANIYGSFDLVLSIKDSAGNEIKKINVPVNVTKPSFDEYYSENTYAGWADGELTTTVKGTSTTPSATINNLAFNIKKQSDGSTPMIGGQPTYKLTYTGHDNVKQENVAATSTLSDLSAAKIVKTAGTNVWDLKVKSFAVKASATAATVKLGGTTATDVTIEKDFTMNLKQAFNAVNVVYYINNVAQDVIPVNADGTVSVLTLSGTNSDVKDGLAFEYGNGRIAVDAATLGTSTAKLGGFQIDEASGTLSTASANCINVYLGTVGSSMGVPTWGANAVTFTGLNAGEGGKLSFTFVDQYGIKTVVSKDYKRGE